MSIFSLYNCHIRKITFFLSIFFICGCTHIPDVYEISPEPADIFPDYTNLTIPVNIAPLNFSIKQADRIVVNYYGKGQKLSVSGKNRTAIPLRKWKTLLKENEEDTIHIELYVGKNNQWTRYPRFYYHVSADTADPYVVYRLIPPGFDEWNRMGIYQRHIETFRENVIISNASTGKNCINCHTFCMNDPQSMVFHMRHKYGGTYILKDSGLIKTDTKSPYTISNCVYPYWHPSGKYIAFSTNNTSQSIHAKNGLDIEVYDDVSDIVILDTERYELFSDPTISHDDMLETYPAFSPDGKKLYFCCSERIKDMPGQYRRIKYSLCSVDFDADSRHFSNVVDTLISSYRTDKSITFAHPSPDGKYILCTLADYGCFPSWNTESDLYLFDLSSSELKYLQEANSPFAEGFTSWSGNSRWIVFSSRRSDGQYNRLYFSHIDASGNPSKAFLLPQKDPEHNTMNLYAYNKPEFVHSKVMLSFRNITEVARKESIPVTFTGEKTKKSGRKKTNKVN